MDKWCLTTVLCVCHTLAVQDSTDLSTGAAAALIGVSDETLRRWVEQGRVRHLRLPSGRLRFRREDVEALLVPVEPEDAA